MRSALYWRVNYTYLHGNDRSSLLLYLSDGFLREANSAVSSQYDFARFVFLTLLSRIASILCVFPVELIVTVFPPMNRNLIQFLSVSAASIWLTVVIKNIAKRLKKGIAFVRINRSCSDWCCLTLSAFRMFFPNIFTFYYSENQMDIGNKWEQTDQIVSQRRVLSSLKFSVKLKDELPLVLTSAWYWFSLLGCQNYTRRSLRIFYHN